MILLKNCVCQTKSIQIIKVFSNLWKKSYITRIFKNGNRVDIKNCRGFKNHHNDIHWIFIKCLWKKIPSRWQLTACIMSPLQKTNFWFNFLGIIFLINYYSIVIKSKYIPSSQTFIIRKHQNYNSLNATKNQIYSIVYNRSSRKLIFLFWSS